METLARWFGPLHPPMTHFPIVCSILAALAFGVGVWKKDDWLLKSASVLWVLTFLSSVASVLLGHLFAHNLGMTADWALIPPPEILKGQLRTHAFWGTLAMLLSIFTLAGARLGAKERPWPAALQLALGLILAVLFGFTGHEGGEMVYGPQEETPSPAPSAVAVPAAGVGLFSLVADYRQNLVKINVQTWNSRTHGHRWVNTYVSKEGVDAYKNSNPLPEGAFVVKESFEDQDGKVSAVPGPLYVMRKGKVSDSPETGGWKYALRWDKPVEGNPEEIQGPVTWLPGDGNLDSCVRCHDHFKDNDYMGGVPSDAMNP